MGATMPAPVHDFHAEGDEDLLVWMSMRDEEPGFAQAACNEFYQRHLNYAYTVVRRAFQDLVGEAAVDDLVSDTFSRVFERAGTYKACGAADANGKRKNVLAWVGKIAHNLGADLLRDDNTRLELIDEWEPLEPRIVPRDDSGISQEAAWAGEALGSLSGRERTVLLSTLQHYVVGAENQRLPNGVAEDLARTYQTTPENIRQIRKRALAKVKQYVEEARLKAPVRSEV